MKKNEVDKKVDRVGEIFSLFKVFFTGGFHTVLWELLVKGTHSKKTIAFTVTMRDGFLGLAIAELNEPGYIPTPAKFASEICNSEI